MSPIYFANDRKSIFFATEKGSAKFRDITHNGLASIVVDEFNVDWLEGKKGSETHESAVVVFGRATIFERGQVYRRMYSKLLAKYPDYRKSPWNEGETPIIKVEAEKIISWGIE